MKKTVFDCLKDTTHGLKKVCMCSGIIGLLFYNHSAAQQKKPYSQTKFKNVIVIIGDDHAAYALSCYGSKVVKTPNLDRLASDGYLFKEAYANCPVCTPSRQSMLTGKLPHAAGVTLLKTALSDTAYTIPEHLKQYGFATGVVGKTHFQSDLSHGFDYVIKDKDYDDYVKQVDERIPSGIKTSQAKNPWKDDVRIWWNAEGLPAPHYDKNDKGTYFANKANAFIEQHKKDRFCLWVGFREPHSPFNFPIEYKDHFRPEDMPLVKGGPEDDRFEPLRFKELNDDERKGIIRSYYTSVEYLDKNIGLILDKLKALNLDDETLVIYFGDNGYLLNHHKRFEKHTMWQEAVKVPLIIRIGKKDRISQPRIINDMVELVDLAPTILEALNIPDMPDLHGRSLLPLLLGKTKEHRPYIFSEYLIDKMAMVRDSRYKYVFMNTDKDLREGWATGQGPIGLFQGLYDLKNDPKETTNLFVKPAYKNIVKRLRTEMLQTFRKTHPGASSVPENISETDQLTRFVFPPEGDANIAF